jgi:hypothetical protein
MLALDKIQKAIVDDKTPLEPMLDNEDYEPPTRRLMLKCKDHAKWEEAEQDELRSFHLCKVLSKTPPIPEGVKPLPLICLTCSPSCAEMANTVRIDVNFATGL